MFLALLKTLSSTDYTFPEAEENTYVELCTKYEDLYVAKAKAPVWTKGDTKCDPGKHSYDDQIDAVNRINFYRYQSGLTKHLVELDSSYDKQCREGAVVLYYLDDLTHTPSSTSECYTKDAYTACSTSNLAMGRSRASNHIDLYMEDSGVASLGHRRWIILPSLATVGVGLFSNFGVLKVIGTGRKNDETAPFVAYPGPGYTLLDASNGEWSLSSDHLTSKKTYTATVVINYTQVITKTCKHLGYGYGQNTISYVIDKKYLTDNTTYQVKITNGEDTYSYFIKMTNCKGYDPSDFGERTVGTVGSYGIWIGVFFVGLGIGIALFGVLFRGAIRKEKEEKVQLEKTFTNITY